MLLLTLAALFSLCLAPFAGAAPAPNPPSGPAILSAAETDYPPFSVVDPEGRAGGFSVELLQAALAAMGREVSFRTGPWSQVRGWLERGEVQALPLVGRTPEREPLFDFTFPYMSLHGAIVIRDGTTGIADLKDLSGRQVAVMQGDNAEEFLRRQERGIRIVPTRSFEQALAELSAGQHDAVVTQRLVALRLIQESGIRNLRVLDRPIEGFRQDFCFAVREGDRATLALLNEGLALVTADGTYSHLHAKWFAALELPSNRRLLIGGDHSFPPYEYLDERGRATGFNTELTRAVAQEAGLEVEIRLGPWAEIREQLERGEIDAVQGMLYSPERDRSYDFTTPHALIHYVAVGRQGEAAPPSEVEELRERNIVVQSGDFMHDFALNNDIGRPLSLADTQEDALRELAQGRYDYALVARRTALYWMKEHGWRNLRVGRRPLASAEYCYAVPQGHRALLAELGEAIKALEDSGEYRRLNEKWMGIYADEPVPWYTILRYVAWIAVPLLLVISATLLWSWTLRRQVARRTAQLEQSEEKLRDSAQHFRNLADSGMALTWTSEAGGRRDWFNQPWLDFTGRSAQQEAGEGWAEGLHPEDRARCRQTYAAAFQRRERFSLIFRLRDREGRYRWVQEGVTPRFDSDGRHLGFIGHCLDITESKQAEERIQHLNRVLRTVRDVNELMVRERSRDSLIREACRVLVDNHGYRFALIVLTDSERRPAQWATAGDAPVSAALDALLRRGELPDCCQRAEPDEGRVWTEDPVQVCAECHVQAVSGAGPVLCARLVDEGAGLGYLLASVERSSAVDSEELALFGELAGDLAYALRMLQAEEARREAERQQEALKGQLLQAQRLESVGRLAGGVAHDFNNMLSIILGYSDLALEKIPPGDPLHGLLSEILGAAKRATDITRQLLGFARQQTIAPKVLDLNETVESMLKMLRRLIGEDIDLAWLPEAGLWQVKIDPAQVDQILANLCLNSRDAIHDAGKITIETENVRLDEQYCAGRPGFQPGEYVLLAVSDNGEGMSREIQEKIFEPFFSTKGVGKGTGLGLSTVYGIVKQNNGFINVYSEPGSGTTFRIYLPRLQGLTAKEEAGSQPEKAPAGHGERVLLVEDESAIIEVCRIMLEELGYRVLAAGTPGQALELARTSTGEVQLLISDVVMPEMNGRELAAKLKSFHPRLKILFMSGYTADVIAHHSVLEEGTHFLQKPFSSRQLAAKVREALESPQ